MSFLEGTNIVNFMRRPTTDLSGCHRGTGPVQDWKIQQFVKSMSIVEFMRHGEGNYNLNLDFAAEYLNWIRYCTTAPASGLEQFEVQYFVNGTTQAYDIFFYEYKGRRFRTLRGEYPYVRLSIDNWAFIEDDELRQGDAVVLSMPFYSTGGPPPQFSQILDRCRDLNIPIFIDGAYYGTCYGTNFDYGHPAIDMVSFSLSKPFCIQSFRAGLLLCKRRFGYLEEIQSAARYFNRMGAYVGLRLMQTFGADYIPLKYRTRHREVCNELGLIPTPSVMLANVKEGDDRFDEILQDDRFEPAEPSTVKRVCISDYLSEPDPLPKKVAKRAVQVLKELRANRNAHSA